MMLYSTPNIKNTKVFNMVCIKRSIANLQYTVQGCFRVNSENDFLQGKSETSFGAPQVQYVAVISTSNNALKTNNVSFLRSKFYGIE